MRDRARALASNGEPAAFAPANRFPGGINVTAAYALSRTVGLSTKTGGGSAGEVSDVLRLPAFFAALDQTLPTPHGVWKRNGTPTTYYPHFTVGSSVVSFESAVPTGVWTVPSHR